MKLGKYKSSEYKNKLQFFEVKQKQSSLSHESKHCLEQSHEELKRYYIGKRFH